MLWDKVWVKEKLDGIKFRTDMQICEDAVYVWDSLKNLKKAVCLPDRLYHYRYIQTSMSKRSSPAKYMKALPAWDYLKKESSNTKSYPAICRNRIVWNLKAAKCLAISDSKEYDYRELRKNIIGEKEHINQLSKDYRISAHILNRSWTLFRIWTHAENLLKKIYIRMCR